MNAAVSELAQTRRKVLVVDDDPIQRKLLAKHLSAAGHSVTSCGGPTEAFAAAAIEAPDVIVSDVLMSDGDGFAFCRDVRADAALGAVPVVLVSAHFDDERDASLAEQVGASALLRRTPSVFPRIAAAVEEAASREPGVASPGDELDRLHAERLRHQLVRLGADSVDAKVRSDALVAQQALLLDQLQHAQRVDTLGQLAAGLAHDFNNALAVILASAQMLRETVVPDDDRRADVEDIEAAAKRAAGLSRRMLSLGRRDDVRRPGRIELNGLVTELGRMLGRVLGSHIRLSLVLAPNPVEVRCDAGELDQLIVNLAINARDAMPDGGVLELSTEEVDIGAPGSSLEIPEGAYTVLSVRDTGCGIDAATQARIFEPFFTTRPSGTGLGLATVREIVRRAKGHVEVLSEAGRGAIFRLYFPRVAARPLRGGETVLVVDDEAFLRSIIAKGLRRQGYQVLAAQDRDEALRVVEAHAGTIDLLVCDWLFPEHTGMDVFLAVRGHFPEVRVLFVSGHEQPVRALPFLPKPFGTSELARSVRTVLDA